MNPYFRTPPVVKNLIIANVLIWLAMFLIPKFDIYASTYGQLFWIGSPLYHPYQFVTYMFLHGGLSHLLFNMFALWMFGRTLEYELGSNRFIVYYMVCGIGAALLQMMVAWFTHEYSFSLIGASGAVMGLLLAFGVMHPNEQIFIIPIPVPIKAKWFVIGYAVLEIFQGWGGFDAGVAHFAHVGGMLWGWLLLYYWKKRGFIRY